MLFQSFHPYRKQSISQKVISITLMLKDSSLSLIHLRNICLHLIKNSELRSHIFQGFAHLVFKISKMLLYKILLCIVLLNYVISNDNLYVYVVFYIHGLKNKRQEHNNLLEITYYIVHSKYAKGIILYSSYYF